MTLQETPLDELLDDLVRHGQSIGSDCDCIPDSIFDKIYDIKKEIISRFEIIEESGHN